MPTATRTSPRLYRSTRLRLARADLRRAVRELDAIRFGSGQLSGPEYPAAIAARDKAEDCVAWHESQVAKCRRK